MDKFFIVVNLFMYEKNGDKEYASILVAEKKEQLKELFLTALSEVKENHTQLEVSAYIIGENLNLNAVASHVRNSIYEEKAVFTHKNIKIFEALPDIKEQLADFEKCITKDYYDDEIASQIISDLA